MVKKSLLLFVLFLIIPLAYAQDDCLYYFYGDGCQDCPATELYLQTLEEKYPDLNIEKFEVYFNKDNLDDLQDFYTSYRIPKASQELPVVFILGTYFIGKSSITSLLEDRIIDNDYTECPSPLDLVVGVIGEGSSKDVLKMLTFFRVSGSAISQAFNQAMIALILILLFVLIALPNNEQMFKKGLVFIVGVYLANLLFGLGWFSFMSSPTIGLVFYKTIAIIAIIVALATVKSFFGKLKLLFDNTPEKIVLQAKKAWQGILSYPGVLIVGFLVSLFTFSLANSTLMILRNLYRQGIERIAVVPLIIFYILILMILLAAVVVALYLIRQKLHDDVEAKKDRMDEKKVEAWKKHTLKVMNLILSVIILILGIVLLFV